VVQCDILWHRVMQSGSGAAGIGFDERIVDEEFATVAEVGCRGGSAERSWKGEGGERSGCKEVAAVHVGF
jgi:hypothetical protein